MTRKFSLGLWLSAILVSPVPAADSITLHALTRDKAIVLVDGVRRVLKAGETSPEGVKLIATHTADETAEVEVNGKPEVLRLGVVISAFTSTGKGSAILYAEPDGHFYTEGLINGISARLVVDTGATYIAMNSAMAQRVGVDYKRTGQPGFANTASGVVRTYGVKLRSVQVGDIVLHNVDAGIIEGTHPVQVLLGMSFLGRLDMKRDGEKLELTQRY